MQGLKFLFIITKRENSDEYTDYLKRIGIKNVVSTLCNGTVNQQILNIMGIEKTEKVMFNALVLDEEVPTIMKGLLYDMKISSEGNGVAGFIPVDCVGGMSSLKYFIGDKTLEKKENVMNMESRVVLIISIVNKGYTENVMDVARKAGAKGGTVIRAKGTGESIAKFFGIPISEEKEIIYILAHRDVRDDIMNSILKNYGANTDAHAILFSLPVDNVVGLNSFEN